MVMLNRVCQCRGMNCGNEFPNQTAWIFDCHYLFEAFMASLYICCNRVTSLRHRFR